QNGAAFVDLQMLVSPDLARAARQAKIKGVKEGALLGLLTAYVGADLPVFQLPSITIPGLDPSVLPTTPTSVEIPGIGTVQIPSS
ncbi:MAG: hypothetical protein Q7T55_08785, partial [Solirubrobacteraceae bacterium]|nr:hypothetical protein [Solirubrobacteraceae bacterium]